MKKSKRILSAIFAVLMAFCCTVPTFALAAMPLTITVDPLFPEPKEPTFWDHVKDVFLNVLQALLNFWHRFALLIIVILLLVGIIVAITISEVEQQKIRDGKKPPKKQHKKK